MTDHKQSVIREGQRGLLGAFLLMLALVVGQFVTVERKISFRSGADPAVTRTAAEKAANRGAPRPLSAGGGGNSSDNWLISGSGDRRIAKVKSAGSGGDPSTDPAFVVSDEIVRVAPRRDAPAVVSFADASPAGTPRHNFEGRAPPARLL